MEIRIVKEKIRKEELEEIAKEWFGDMIKAIVDIKEEVMSLGGELHSDGFDLMIENNYAPENLWGINIYPNKKDDDRIEFISLINIRPHIGNCSMEIENRIIRGKIMEIINKLIPE